MVQILQMQDPAIEQLSDQLLISKKQCSQLSLKPIKFELGQDTLVQIPPKHFTKTIDEGDLNISDIDVQDYNCRILFELNYPRANAIDQVFSDDDGEMKEVRDCYILGLPFVQSFTILLDFEKNRVGLAQKDYDNEAFIKHEEPVIIDDPDHTDQTTDEKEKEQPSDKDDVDNKPSDTTSDQDQEQKPDQ